MVNRPPFDRDPPPPGGFNPRYGGVPDPRAPRAGRYDEDAYQQGEASVGPDPYRRADSPPPPPPKRGMSRSTKLLLALGLLLLLGAVAFGLSLTRSGPGSDRLDGTGDQPAAKTQRDPEARCAAPATYDRIKRELFRQAAATRGTDQAVFDRLSAAAVIRVSSPVLREEDEGLERVSCAGQVSLDLPPGLQVVGGRRSLSANLAYSLQPAADGSGDVVTLSGAEAITAPLATLARTAAPVAPPPPPPAPGLPPASDVMPSMPPPAPAPAPVPSNTATPAPTSAPPTAAARPSFNCARARTGSERAVCASPELAALDRQMADFFTAARRDADPQTRALLDRTRSRFLTYRNRCGTDRCIADAYRGRITEIRDIVDGRWTGR